MSANAKQIFQSNDLLETAIQCRQDGDSEKALEIAIQAISFIESSLEKFHPDRLSCISLIAALYADLGKEELAFEYMQKLEELLADPELKDTPLGITYKLDLIYFYETREFFQRVGDLLLEAQESLGRAFETCSEEQRPEFLPIASDIYRYKGGRDIKDGYFAEAEGAFDLALYYSEELYGPQDPNNAALLLDIARANKSQLDYEKARKNYERALVIYETNNGALHSSVGFVCQELSTFLLSIGNLALSSAMAQKAGVAFRRSFGPKSLENAQIELLLAEIRTMEENYEEAAKLTMKALEIARVAASESPLDFIQFLDSAVNIFRLKGDIQKSEELEQELKKLLESNDIQ